MRNREVPPSSRSLMREYLESLLVAIFIALVLRYFVIAAYKIPTGSMTPTLKIGDCIFAWKLPYGVRIPFSKISLLHPQIPKRGDVVVFRYPEDEAITFVKRVVGIPGDKIEIRQKRLFINDSPAVYGPAGGSEALTTEPMKQLYIVENETFTGSRQSHLVMFRRGEDDDAFGPEVVPPDRFFVMGDNRDSSDDSRSWGMVPLDNLEGRAFMIWCSFDWEKKFKSTDLPTLRKERIFSSIR